MTAYGAEGGAVDNANMGTNLNEATSGDSIGATGFEANASLVSIWVKSAANKSSTNILLFLDMPFKGHLEAGSPRKLTLLCDNFDIVFGPGSRNSQLHTNLPTLSDVLYLVSMLVGC